MMYRNISNTPEGALRGLITVLSESHKLEVVRGKNGYFEASISINLASERGDESSADVGGAVAGEGGDGEGAVGPDAGERSSETFL